MRRSAVLFPALVFLFISSYTQAVESPREMTGLEWLEASMGDRMDRLLASMLVLTQSGVGLNQSPQEYESSLEENIRNHPELYTMNVTDILAKYIYEHEPLSRASLDKLRKKPEIKKIEMH